jgi:hypothetical protein
MLSIVTPVKSESHCSFSGNVGLSCSVRDVTTPDRVRVAGKDRNHPYCKGLQPAGAYEGSRCTAPDGGDCGKVDSF